MKKKRIVFEKEVNEILNQKEYFKVLKKDDNYFFEIGLETTSDIAELVSILMRTTDYNDPIWKTTIYEKMINDNISPIKSLYWLTGGDSEWKTLINYSKQWCECNYEFCDEFGDLIIDIVKKSKTLTDIRKSFIKNLNIPILYEFALSKNLIK
jgi:hypothetical protein